MALEKFSSRPAAQARTRAGHPSLTRKKRKIRRILQNITATTIFLARRLQQMSAWRKSPPAPPISLPYFAHWRYRRKDALPRDLPRFCAVRAAQRNFPSPWVRHFGFPVHLRPRVPLTRGGSSALVSEIEQQSPVEASAARVSDAFARLREPLATCLSSARGPDTSGRGSQHDLSDWRRRIDEIDKKLVQLLTNATVRA